MANNVAFDCFLTGSSEIEHCCTNGIKWSNAELTLMVCNDSAQRIRAH